MTKNMKHRKWLSAGIRTGLMAVWGCTSVYAQSPSIDIQPASATIFIGDEVTFEVQASGSDPLSYQWLRGGTTISGATSNSLRFATTAADDGDLFSVQVSNTSGSITSDLVELTVDFGTGGAWHTNRLVEITTPWRYDVSKTDLGSAWRQTNYVDDTWAAGGGLLYVETGGLPAPKTTALPLVANDLPATCYFRTSFTNSISDVYSLNLVANTVVDDGVVLYLNGTEVLRNLMAAGPVEYSTGSTGAVGNAAFEGPFNLDAASLVHGENLLAVEVHQYGITSSDIVMGLTLDVVWQERVHDNAAPEITSLLPEGGLSVTSLTQIAIHFNEAVLGVDAADLLINGVGASSITVVSASEYIFQFPEPASGVVSVTWASGHGIIDLSPYGHPFSAGGFSYVLTAPSDHSELSFILVEQSSDFSASTEAVNAVDGSSSSYSLTQDLPGSYWEAELGRPFEVDQIQVVNRISPDDAEMEGLTLSLFNMDDQVVFETVLSNPGSGGIAVIDFPEGTIARSIRFGLSGTDTNGAGNYRVGLAAVRLFGVPNIPFSPPPFDPEEVEPMDFTVAQSTDYSASYSAANAVDGNASTFSHTDTSTPDNFWIADLGTTRSITSVELVNRASAGAHPRMTGLTLRILDDASNSVASVVTTTPGSGGTYTFTPPANTSGRYVRVGLENGAKNGTDDYVVSLAEVRVLDGSTNWLGGGDPSTLPDPTENLATSKRSYMLRIADTDAPPSNVNDGDFSTEARTTSNAFDGYWEVDLGATYALYGVRAIAPSDLAARLGYTILRLYDENHDSVHSQPVDGSSTLYDIDLNGPVFARYVRIGLEDKTRPNESNQANKYEIGLNEVEVFGRPAIEVGILSLGASDTTVSSGQDVTLDWSVVDVKRVEIYPGVGSVGAQTATNGTGSLSQSMTESTEFILVATNNAGIFTRAVGVEVDGSPLSVRISEVVADNKYSMEDGYGDAPDWIELRNTGNSTVDLTGWGLSDNELKPMKWVFPATNMPPHSTLIVFASKNDASVDPEGNLHADFSLGKNGESVYLTAADGVTTMDSLDYPELDTDLAYGRDLEGNWTLIEPTPGAVNTGDTYSGWLESLDWSHARGFYETNFTLSVTSEDPEATVLYSLDGSIPSVPYTGGLSIDGTQSVRIQSMRDGYKPARIQTKTFIFLDDVITSPLMNTDITQDEDYAARMKPGLLSIPTISLVVPSDPAYPEQACSMEILWPDGGNPVQENCGISLYGGAVQTFDKWSYKLSFRSEYGNGKLSAPLFNGFDHGLLAKTSFDKLQLHAGNQDRTTGFYMSDRFVQDSLLDMGSLNPHGRFVHIYLNGEYWGQYNCKELMNTSFLADYLGGEKDDYVDVQGNNNDRTGIAWSIGVGDPPDPEPWERVRALRDDFEAVSPYLDVSHFIDVMLLWGYGGSEQEFKGCGPRDAGSGYKLWLNDSDRFLVDRSSDRLISTFGPGYIWSGLLGEADPDFMMLLADRMYRNYFNRGAMTPAACDARLVARMDEIRDSFLAEAARWGYVSPETWESKAATIRANMFPYHTDELIAQWREFGWFPSFDPPTFNQFGGPVEEGFQPELTSSDGTIYYTLDGSDPRLSGGMNNPAALIWSAGDVIVTEDIKITTRVRASDGTWSALAEPHFLLGSRQLPVVGDLLITEIHYNPDGSDEYEFIEIWNTGTNLLDLSGVNLSNAVRTIFPEYSTLSPGAFVVVCEDSTAFSNRYQDAASPWYWAGVEVAGEWVGGLSDGGETIFLAAADGSLISSVSYNAGGDWPDYPDGGGSSLELSNPTLVPDDASAQSVYLADGRNWTASSLYHGSPGRFESAVPSVVINEVLSHTDVGVDWIELYNGSEIPVDLTGYALTDDLQQPTRYLFPTDSMVPANGTLTVSAADLGFGFSELGSSASLLEVSGSTVLRFLDRVEFPAVAREESFGRYLRSDGIPVFTEQASNSYADDNSLPRVGPVVISEIMVFPTLGKSAYVELYNISDSNVPLYDLNISSNVWKFSGVGNYAFPQGVVLPPLTPMILCATNPAVFRAQYGIDPSVPVYGPWSGYLDADGEMLELLSPGDPEPDGFVPHYRADYVAYRTNANWAVANTGGVSLERYPLNSYGNDPISWEASTVGGSPGTVGEYRSDLHSEISMVAGGSLVIGFPAILGQSYEVHYTDSLTPPMWDLLLSVPAATTNWIKVTDPEPSVSNRFYRIYWELN